MNYSNRYRIELIALLFGLQGLNFFTGVERNVYIAAFLIVFGILIAIANSFSKNMLAEKSSSESEKQFKNLEKRSD